MIIALAKGLQEKQAEIQALRHNDGGSLGGGLLVQPRANTTVLRAPK